MMQNHWSPPISNQRFLFTPHFKQFFFIPAILPVLSGSIPLLALTSRRKGKLPFSSNKTVLLNFATLKSSMKNSPFFLLSNELQSWKNLPKKLFFLNVAFFLWDFCKTWASHLITNALSSCLSVCPIRLQSVFFCCCCY